MRVSHLSAILVAALAVCLCGVKPAAADESPGQGPVVGPERLVAPSELDAISLSMVDEKIALSLAVETHIQIELAQFALARLGNEELKQLTVKKLGSYRQLLNTLEELTGGRAGKILARAGRHLQTTPPGTSVSRTSTTEGDSRARAKPGRKGGIGDVIQNAATQTVLRVRLDIAQQYADLLRAELETATPGEFDRRYLAIEVFNQMQVLAMLRVFERQASTEFARIIHLATASAEALALEAHQVTERLHDRPGVLPTGASPMANTADTGG
jgi:hypothetical protein